MRGQILVTADTRRSWSWRWVGSSRGSSATSRTGRLGQDNDAAGPLALVLISKGSLLTVVSLISRCRWLGPNHLVGKGLISTNPSRRSNC